MNATTEAFALLEKQGEGTYAKLIAQTIKRQGCVHISSSSWFAGYSCWDKHACFYVSFACGDLPEIGKILLSMGFATVRFSRRAVHGAQSKVREHSLLSMLRKRNIIPISLYV